MSTATEHPVRILVAVELAAGAWVQAVCRTSGCPWRGPARPERWLVERDQNSHRQDHLEPRR
ncbi:hypothetical protein [Nonomuraea typhae]|uniref:hypothetical protein n=1 Tax=Nonomuraea typhae TaxID=2603600 RepID=UPI0012F8DB2C|nr:hypothetical protein [Nonomuraea typhae]